MIKKILAFLMVVAIVSGAAACTQSDQTQDNDGASISGKVVVDGSGTVYPLMAHIAEQYMTREQSEVNVQVGRAGSSAGFKKFIAGETDFSDASRPIKDEEVAQLKEKDLVLGSDILEFKLALDGLTFVINKENDWAGSMTHEELVGLYKAGEYRSDDAVLWSDVRDEWPEEPIQFYGPNENHGTYEFFYENILEKADMVQTVNLQQEYATLVDLVSQDPYAIAFFGFGYYVSNTDKLTAVAVDFGSGPVEPTLETIGENLPYAPFTRPVFTYLNVPYALEKPQVLDFAKYVVSKGAPELASENGFAPLPQETYNSYLKQLEALEVS